MILKNNMADSHCLDKSAVDVLKATQQGTVQMPVGCILAPPGEYN